MAYVSVAQLIERFGQTELIQLTDADGVGLMDESAITSAIADAEALIDAELRAGGYTLPLSTIPREIERAAAILARCELYDTAMPEYVADQCKDTRAWLRSVARGATKLAIDEAGSIGIAAPTRVMTYDDDLWDGYAQ